MPEERSIDIDSELDFRWVEFLMNDAQSECTMNGNTLSNLWLIGASQMAQDYAHVLKKLDVHFKVIGRGESSAKGFESALEFRFKQEVLKQLCK